MKTTKRRTQLSEKKNRKETQYKREGKDNSRYAEKHRAQLKGNFNETSPLPEYKIQRVVVNGKSVNMKVLT